MSEKKRKTQAERAADNAKKRKATAPVKGTKTEKAAAKPADKKDKSTIPIRVISSLACIGLFVIFLVSLIWPSGWLVKLFSDFIHGMIGRAGYIVITPVLLFLFVIHAFSGERPIKMRTVCLLVFTFACGCITHLSLPSITLPDDITLLGELYRGGIEGTTGGVLCGGITMLVEFLCGRIISYIAWIITALFTLLGGMQITIPSIVRAVQNRPRSDWEDENKPERQEPATLVVDHFARKRIEYLEKRRQRDMEEPAETPAQEVPAVPVVTPSPADTGKRAAAIISQIDSDVEDPVAAAGTQQQESVPTPEIIPIHAPSAAPKAHIQEVTPLETTLEPSAPAETDIDPGIVEEVKKEKVTEQAAQEAAAEVALEIAQTNTIERPAYQFPPIDLLKMPFGGATDGTAEMRENTQRLNETLASFKIEAHIINVTRGPSVTRYEVELEKGVRLNKLTSAADDIALSLGAMGVRIAAIPGKISVVGIEVPNIAVTTVSLREVIDSQEFRKAKSKSSFAVGKDIGGSCIVGNIAKLPHMLIAGTTGSGKSVCMNSIIISLLYKASPEDVKLIMVDPKMVELGIYNGIPHLLIPVVTDPKKAAGSLQWAVTEMMRRYKAMSDAGVRDLESYNSIIESQEVDGNKLPQIVVIIDELADLMLVAAKEVEESICRIAQMGRAAGIHLIIATQRPSADVITGLMKANIPSRIAFAVASAMESRIILDTQGAEKLVGKGDMLYAPIGNGKPKRVQGCFVTDAEVEAIATFVKENCVTNYDEEVLEEIEKKAAQTGNKTTADPEPNSDELDGDEMLPAAVEVILETGQASVSMLQRRLKLGYARAARIVDEMEDKGIVGPFMGAKPRNILITREQWEQMRSGQTAQLGFEDLDKPPAFGDSDDE